MSRTATSPLRQALALFLLCGAFGCGSGPAIAPDGDTRRLTDWPGAERAVRLSPDGGHAAIEASANGESNIYLLSLADGETRQLTHGPGPGRRPAWSADGRRIAYLTRRDDIDVIRTIAIDGADDSLLFAANAGERLGGPDWSPDGSRIALTRTRAEANGSQHTTILVVDVATGAAEELTTTGDEWWPRWDKNSDWLYYYIGETDEIMAVHGRTKIVRSISNGAYTGWRPVPSPDGESILFISEMEKWSVWIAPIDGSHPPLRLTTVGADDYPDFSPDGKHIIFSSDRGEAAVIRYDLETGQRKLLASNGGRPQQTADGRIAFLAPGNGTLDIAIHNRDGAAPDIFDVAVKPVLDFAISPDGARIAVVTMGFLDGQYRIEILDREGRETGVSTGAGRAEKPVWCGDNTTLLYSGHQSGDAYWQIRAIDAETGTIETLTHSDSDKRPSDCSAGADRIAYYGFGADGGLRLLVKQEKSWIENGALRGVSSKWSPDGRSRAFLDHINGQTDIFLENADGEILQVTNDRLVEEPPVWSRDGAALLFAVSTPNRDIWEMDLPTIPW